MTSWGQQETRTFGEMEQGAVPLAPGKPVYLTEKTLKLLHEAFVKWGNGETITWHLIVQALPIPAINEATGTAYLDDQGNPMQQWPPMLLIYAEIPSVVSIGEGVWRCTNPVSAWGWSEAVAERIVKDLMNALYQSREAEKKQVAEKAMPQNGAPSGLILPGR